MVSSDGHPHCVLPQNLLLHRSGARIDYGQSPASLPGQPQRSLEHPHARVVPLLRQQVSFLEDLLGDG